MFAAKEIHGGGGKSHRTLAIAPGRITTHPSRSSFVHPPMYLHHFLLVEEAARHKLEDGQTNDRLQLAGDAFRLGLVKEATVYHMILDPSAQPQGTLPAQTAPQSTREVRRHQRERLARLLPPPAHHMSQPPSYVNYPVGMHASLPADYGALCDAIHDYAQAAPPAPPPTAATSPPETSYATGHSPTPSEEDPAMGALYERLFGAVDATVALANNVTNSPYDVLPPSPHMRGVCDAVHKSVSMPKHSASSTTKKRRIKQNTDERGRLSLPNIHLTSPRGKRDEAPRGSASEVQLDDEKLFKQYMRRIEGKIRSLSSSVPPPLVSPRSAATDLGGASLPRPSIFGRPSPRQHSIAPL